MDHLPELSGDPSSLPDIPFLCEQQYDGLGFTSYPHRRGWDKNKLKSGDFIEQPVEQTRAFLQEWLFFGLLAEFFGEGFKSDDFVVQKGDGQSFITTRKLPEYSNALYEKIRSFSYEERIQHDTFIRPILLEANGMCFNRITEAEPNCPLSDEVRMSIILVGETLDYILHHIWSSKATNLDVSRWFGTARTSALDWGDCRLPKTRMLDAGWCPNEVKRLSGSRCNNAMFYASCLRRSIPNGFHRECSADRCVANQVKRGSYRTRHTEDACDCAFVHVQVDKVKDILGRGNIALIRHSGQAGKLGSGDIDVVEYQPGLHYVAISHVWSDGLGNEAANALPTCRILDVARAGREAFRGAASDGKQANSLGPNGESHAPILFWIDTLCIPCAETDKNFRKLAISRLKEIYRCASRVLVLDAELRQHCVGSLEEALLRLSCSGWMRRLWTLEEGIMGEPRLYVAFKDEALCVADARETLWECEDNDPAICHAMISFVTSTAVWSISLSTGSRRIAWILAEMRWRTTSRREDIEVVFAQLMGVDPAKFMDTPLESRMQTIYASLDEYPQFTLFNPGQRIQEDGYRWAMSSVPAPSSQNVRIEPGQRCDEGLVVKYPALVAIEASRSADVPGSRFYMQVQSSKETYCVICRELESITRSPLLDQCPSKQLVVLFDSLFLRYMAPEGRQQWEGLWLSACIAFKYKEVAGRTFAIYRRSAKISRVSEEEYAAWVAGQGSGAEWRRIVVKQTRETCSWCIG